MKGLLAAGTAIGTTITMWGVAERADAGIGTCGSGYYKWASSTLRVDYMLPNSTYVNAFRDSNTGWDGFTDISIVYAPGQGDIFYTAYNAGASGPGGYTEMTTSGCQGVVVDGYFNRYYTDDYKQAKLQVITAHEFGHALFFADIGGSAECSPDTIMLNNVNRLWNGTCQWNQLRTADAIEVNHVYP